MISRRARTTKMLCSVPNGHRRRAPRAPQPRLVPAQTASSASRTRPPLPTFLQNDLLPRFDDC